MNTNKNFLVFDNTFYDFQSNKLKNPVETENFYVIQAVDSQYFEGCDIAKHTQCCQIELTAMLLGSMACNADDDRRTLQKNEVEIVFEGQPHSLKIDRLCRFQTIAFQAKPTSRYFSLVQKLIGKFPTNDRIVRMPQLKALVAEAVAEFYLLPSSLAILSLDSLLSRMIILLLRAGDEQKRTQFDEDALILSLVQQIDGNFKQMLTVFELTKQTNYSYSVLYKAFSARYGITPKKYLTYKKMEYACECLTVQACKLEQLAEQLNYASAYNFSRAFKEYVGVSPSEYKKSPFPLRSPLHEKIPPV